MILIPFYLNFFRLLGMSNLSLRSILDTCKLTGPNFLDWERNVRLVLRQENIEYVLDTPVPKIPDANSPEFATFDLTTREKHVTDAKTVQCVMLAAMSMELQRQHDRMSAFEMLEHLKSLFDSESQTLEYELLTDIFKCRLQEGGNVSEHVLKMIGIIERVATTGIKFEDRVSAAIILYSLPSSFTNFIVNYNLNKTKATMPELHNMLKSYEASTSKGKIVLMVSSNAKSRSKNKQKKKGKVGPTPTALKPKGGGHMKPKVAKDVCLYCKEKGHWKRDCELYKANLAKAPGASSSEA
ncbi:unnamed protein product [Cuscuta europaea]|uniref:CCHC-type domain-containing protein n=1 Tax=Cuscuta europaea TaxID=41803 RepID=A0A9P1E6G2_CUSEU|nr:unnamed protein product [Cuscuta europaea]